MTRLHPSIGSIKSSYRVWLKPDAEPGGKELSAVAGEQPLVDWYHGEIEPPAWLADLIRRHVAAQPVSGAPSRGDVVVLSPEITVDTGEDGLPLVMLLDRHSGDYWSGWLVGAHADYAGSQDIVLEKASLEDGLEPAPLAAMVQTWNWVHLHLPAQVSVLHTLTGAAMDAVRAISLAGAEPDVAPAPGRMCLRQAGEVTVITGTPYGRDDPRDEYLLLSHELADALCEPSLERGDREYGDDEPEY